MVIPPLGIVHGASIITSLRVHRGRGPAKSLADMLVPSIGRFITLPGIPYDPSICNLALSHSPAIPIGRMDLRRGAKLGPVRRPGRARMGPTAQKVRFGRRLDRCADMWLLHGSELKGSWDVAVPRVNRRRRGRSVGMMGQQRLGG